MTTRVSEKPTQGDTAATEPKIPQELSASDARGNEVAATPPSTGRDDPQRLARDRLVVLVPHGQVRIVGEDGADADEHGVDTSPQRVHVGSGRRGGDPAAGPVQRGDAPVDGHSRLPRDEGPAQPRGGEEHPVAVLGEVHGGACPRLVHLRKQDDVDAGIPQPLGAARGAGPRVADGDQDAGDARGDECLGARARCARNARRVPG